MGENAASRAIVPAGTVPAGWRSADTYPRPMPMPRSITSDAPASSVQICSSGFRTSTPVASDTSAPVTALGPVASSRVSMGSPEGTLTASFFRLRSTSCVLSGTPGSGVSESRTPWIRAQATAAPGMMLSRVRRRELPTVRA